MSIEELDRIVYAAGCNVMIGHNNRWHLWAVVVEYAGNKVQREFADLQEALDAVPEMIKEVGIEVEPE